MRPSRFLREIPQQYFGKAQTNQAPHPSPQSSLRFAQRTTPIQPATRNPVRPNEATSLRSNNHLAGQVRSDGQSSTANGIRVGSSVLHERFGRGMVQALVGTGFDAKATVCFENAGTKVLMLRFAKLTVL